MFSKKDEVTAMKKIFLSLGFLGIYLGLACVQMASATTPASNSGSQNNQYACQPPFLSQAAKPNIHFVLDITGSMKDHPYLSADNTYDTATGYWGYFKENMYYSYDVSANNYWQENAACSNSDLIGSPNCVSGKLLNYVTSNKLDIMRKILTGGRVWSSDATVLEHDQGVSNNLANEATTNCDFNNSTAGKVNISSPDPSTVSTTISSSSSTVKITVARNFSKATFTRASGSYSTTGIVPGMQIVTSGFSNSGNNGTWTIDSITSTVITITTNAGTMNESLKKSVTIKTASTLTGPTCKVLVKSLAVPIAINSGSRTFTRSDGGSFVTDGWVVGMVFDSYGFSNSGNNKSNGSWTISSVTANVITISSGTLTTETAAAARLSQNLTAYVRVKSTTSAADFTGLIQTLYKGPGDINNKADIELSFFDTNGGISYTGGSTTNSTVKNQAQTNYIGAVNGSASSGSTNTGPAMAEAEKFFQQVAVDSATHVPSSGTALIAKANGDSDPYYDPPASGTATSSNSTAASCRKSFVILVSDGEWNNGSDPVGPAYHMHRRDTGYDLRTDTALPGTQSVTVYTVYAFGDTAGGRNALITTAIYGGFDDMDNNGLPYPFTSAPTAPPYGTSAKLKTALNTTGYTDSKSVAGSTTLFFADDNPTFPLDQCNPNGTWNASCAEWDKSPVDASIGLKHTGLPYNYFEATDGAVLAQAMINAINDILARTSSSTAASILGNNDNAGATLVQAIFYPEKQFDGNIKASWLGEVQSFWYYLDPTLNNITMREDSVEDLKLKLTEDKAVEFTFDGTYTKVNLFSDANGDGVIDNHASPDATVDLEAVKNIWRAGKTLWARSASDRTIYVNDPTVTAVTGSLISFDSSNASTLRPYLDVAASSAVPTATEVINYARGTDISASYSVRPRAIQIGSTTNTWKLGDVIDSTPKMVSAVRLNTYNLKAPFGYSDTTYDKFAKSKDYSWRGTAFVGANDGMMHAFKTGTNFIGNTQGIVAEIKNADGTTATDLGKELWAFVPKNVLPYLQYMMLPNYQHMYFVDSTPLLIDASIGFTNIKNSDGSSITNPCNPSSSHTYHNCARRTTYVSGSSQLDYSTTADGSGTSWRTVLIGSLGLGGATSQTKAATTGVSIAVASAGKTFTRTSGSFLTDGWAVGMQFTANGFSNAGNNSMFTISGVSALVITSSTATGLVTETAAVNLSQNNVKTPLTDPNDSTRGFGYSSFFALDVTNPIADSSCSSGTCTSSTPSSPNLLWEFSDPRMGYSTVTPTIIRMKDSNDSLYGPTRNGRWYAVLASGPTGPITNSTLSFEGKSDQPLTIFILDLRTGDLVKTYNNLAWNHAFNTASGTSTSTTVHTQVAAMPSNAFAGSLSNASIDVDKTNSALPGFYSDDAVYIGYTKADTGTPVSWSKGGILRLLTYNQPQPHVTGGMADWQVSTVIDNIGPVRTAITKLQDVASHNLWLFFGTGRYFTKGDDPVNVQSLYGIKDPCYYDTNNPSTSNTFKTVTSTTVTPCTSSISASATATGVSGSTLVDQTSSITTTTVNGVAALATGKDGWFINLPGATGSNYPKRVITNPVASSSGAVTFTTFTPSTDVCTYGGTTSVWMVNYSTGGVGSTNVKGQILIQLSTGAFQQIDPASAFTQSAAGGAKGRETVQYQGVPPVTEPAMFTNTNHTPSKRILHIQER